MYLLVELNFSIWPGAFHYVYVTRAYVYFSCVSLGFFAPVYLFFLQNAFPVKPIQTQLFGAS